MTVLFPDPVFPKKTTISLLCDELSKAECVFKSFSMSSINEASNGKLINSDKNIDSKKLIIFIKNTPYIIYTIFLQDID
jgi:hypothetical protein